MKKNTLLFSLWSLLFTLHAQDSSIILQGIIDFSVPSGGNDGKAIHLVATSDIADISIYGIGVANNGGGTDGQEETFPVMSVSAGDDILLARTPSAMESYFGACYASFEHVLTSSSAISQNGDDAIELFQDSLVIETFGDIDTDGTGESWEYLDSWAYKVDGGWTYGAVNCTDGTTTTLSSSCIYPLCDTGEEITGCTDSLAFNYNPNAVSDDGSCIAVSEGCMIMSAANYDETVNTPCEDCCEFSGCTDSLALNFDESFTLDDGSCIYNTTELSNALSLQGIMDFTVPSGGSDGKAIHLVALSDIADISIFGIGVANNGGGTDGLEETLPIISVSAGDDILLARTPSVMEAYFADCYTEFEHVLLAGSDISQNGDDAIELYESGVVIETFGDIDTDGTGEVWEYMDSWAYKVGEEWTYGGVDCSDGSETTQASTCPYPMCEAETIVYGCTDASALNYDSNATSDDESCEYFSEELTNALSLQGIIDFTVPSGGSSGKAIHLYANGDIADLSLFALGIANNGGGTDSIEYILDSISVNAGDDILIVRSDSVMNLYFGECYSNFEHVLIGNNNISQNGDDAVELYELGVVIDTFGDIDTDGTGEAWEYLDSWAYKVGEEWTYGGVDCTDGSTSMFDASCPYPICNYQIIGCTDSLAFNYNPNATEDDGSCISDLLGCTDPLANNFNNLATENDGSCSYDISSNELILQGIIDFSVPSGGNDGKAIHLVATSDIADISIYGIGVANNGGGTDGQEETFPVMSVSAGDDILLARTPSAMESYFGACYASFEHVLTSSSAISQNGDDAIELFQDSLVIETFGDIDTDGTGESWEYLDSWAYKVDGGWTYGAVNCTDGTTTTLSSSCIYPLCDTGEEITGCTDSLAFNYNPNAVSDDGSCIAVSEGCMIMSAANYDETVNTPCEDCCEFSGCTDSLALNFDESFTLDDGSCIYNTTELSNALSLQGIMDFTVPSGGSDGKAIHLVALSDIADISIFGIGVANNGGGTDGLEETLPIISVSAGDDILLARTPSVMEAYFADCYTEFEHVLLAGSDISQNGDDAIELYESGVVIETFGDIDTDGTGEVWEYMDSWAYKVGEEWTYGGVDCSDGSETTQASTCPYPMCEAETIVYGCTDANAFNYNSAATEDDGSCIDVIEGCTNVLASNYDEMANTENGSCIILGCTDSTFVEYNSEANEDDGSCVTPIGLGIGESVQGRLKVVRMFDILGQTHLFHPKGKILFYLYDNGKVSGKFK